MTGLADVCAALAGGGGAPMPWLAPYRRCGRAVAIEILAGRSVLQALNAALQAQPVSMGGARRLRFVEQSERPDGVAYETFIARTGCVPTRDNLHDLFNGLVWLKFGRLKQHLNALHAQEIARNGIGGTRGAVRDALTLFDENAALLQAPAELVDALRQRDWQALFIHHRAAWQGARLTLFGHALLEKLAQPRKAITAHVWVLPEALVLESFSLQSGAHDMFLADVSNHRWPADEPHLAMPVLGVPGWWPANEDEGFYRDEAVFRPAAPRRGVHATSVDGRSLNPHNRPYY